MTGDDNAPGEMGLEPARKSEKFAVDAVCRNCGTTLLGEHCHFCGQPDHEPRRAVIGLVQDVIVDTMAIDGKLFRTIAILLTRPGRLAQRYLVGQRVRYSPPFRLYLFASVFFFFAAFGLIDGMDWSKGPADANEDVAEVFADANEIAEEVRAEIAAERAAAADDDTEDVADASGEAPAEPNAVTFTDTGVDIQLDEEDGDWKPWEETNFSGPEWLEPHARRLYEAGQRVTKDPRLFLASVKENVPRFMLLAPVLYGLTLTLLYIYRRKFFVFDHFIVSLYMHAALYAYLLLAIVLSKIPVIGWLWFVPIAWGAFQPMMVFRQAYRSNWFSVIAKFAISITIYLIVVALVLTLGLSYSLYQS